MSPTRAIPAILACIFCLCFPAGKARAAPPATTRPSISLTTTTEEGKRLLLATVTIDSKPVESATVSFGARRLFGTLLVGEEKTLDDGTAAVAFPADLPGGSGGMLEVTATLQPTNSGEVPVKAVASFPTGAVAALSAAGHSFPRALWAPQAPITLIAIIFGFVGAVWLTYVYVVLQLIRLKRGART